MRLLIACVALASAFPAIAQPIEAPAAPQIEPPADLGVEAFYGTRNGAPLWLKDEAGRAAARRIAALLREARIVGLADGPTLANNIDAAIQGGTPADDKTISAAWVSYVRAWNGPIEEVSYGDPERKPKSLTAVAILHEAAAAP